MIAKYVKLKVMGNDLHFWAGISNLFQFYS